MYKKYKLGLCKNGVSHGTPDVSTCGEFNLRDGSRSYKDGLIKEKVRRCWEEIENQCMDGERVQRQQEEEKDEGGWRTIRVFVSSTFTDFHSERETLVKKVFPALREWCEDHQLHLVECDLRWGVPKDSTTGATLIACMEEIDRGYRDNDGEPFFLGMLSERYGWIPDVEMIPEDIQSRYDWVPDVSVTHMEILHGAYRLGNPSAVFFLRDPDYVSDLPSNHIKRFVDRSPLSVCQLQMLKEKLQEKFPAQVIKYHCQVGGVDSSTGREKVQIIGLKEFAEQALTFLKTAIRRRHLHCKTSATPLAEEEQERRLHQAMAESKSRLVIGRDRELTTLLDFSRGDLASFQLWSSTGQTEEKNGGGDADSAAGKSREDDTGSSLPSLLCVLGAAGIGKSAVMARTARTLQQTGVHVLYHHVGCTVSSLNRDNVTARVVSSLATQLQGEELQSDSDFLPSEHLTQILKIYTSTDRHAVLVIDGIDELTESSKSGDVSWLRSLVSDNVRCIVSVRSSHLPIVVGLKRLNCHKVELAALEVDNCRQLAEHYFSVYNKRLDDEQLDHLIQHSGAATPLWLAVACEELRVFGDFATLTSQIASLPPELDGLLAAVLLRLLREDDTNLMRQLLCVLYCCPAGCPEEHIQSLLGDGQTDVPLLTWVTLRRYLKAFIRMTSHPATRTVRMQFFHDSIRQAVRKTILTDISEEKQWHRLLADFYEHRCKNNAFLTEDLPVHLLAASCTQRLLDFYRKDMRAMHVPAYYRRLYLNKLRCHETIFAHSAMMGTKPLSMCQFCAHKTGVFGRMPWLAKNACCVCGEMTGARGMGREAQLCRRHAPFTAPGVTRCGVCGHNVMGEMAQKMTTAVLCNFCNVGLSWNKCCKLVTDSS